MNQLKPATTYPAIVGRILETRRKELSLDQSKLAKTVGVAQSTWSRAERGTVAISVEQLAKAARAMRWSPGQVLTQADKVASALPAQGIQVEAERVEDPLKVGLLLIGAAALTALVVLILARGE
jgi:transcriptional regulator with XRE-family HTH domain